MWSRSFRCATQVKKRLLLIATQSLFGTGVSSLLEGRKDHLEITTVSDVQTAIQQCRRFQPDVVVYFKESSRPADQPLLQELISRCQARVIQCTLEANQLTVYDHTEIKNATVEDLMTAVLK
jgi:chemotaxis response regulator CheB